MAKIASFRASKPPQKPAPLTASAEAVVRAFAELMKPLSPIEQESVLSTVGTMTPKNATPRAGAVLGAIVRVLERERAKRRTWKMDEIKRCVAAEGVKAEPRQVFNAVAYLARRGRMRQTGYGEYLLLDYGVTVSTYENLGVEPPRYG